MKCLVSFIVILLFLTSCACNDISPGQKGIAIHQTKTGYMMVLEEGEDILGRIEELARNKEIQGATISAIGFAKVEFGYFDSDKKKFEKKQMPAMELVSLMGSIAWEGDKPIVHAHGVVSDKNFKTYGGHLLEARVGKGSAEITIIKQGVKFKREMNEDLGAKVLRM